MTPQVEDDMLLSSMNIDKAVKPKQSRESVSKECEDLIDVEEVDTEIRFHPQLLDVVCASSEDSE